MCKEEENTGMNVPQSRRIDMADKQTYLNDLEARLAEARRKVDELRAGLKDAEADRIQYDTKIDELSRHIRSLENEANKLRQVGEEEPSIDLRTSLEETWNAFKAGVSVIDEMGKRTAFVSELESRLDEGHARIRELEAKADQTEGETKRLYQRHLDILRSKLKTAEDKLKDIKTSRTEAWGSLKGGVEDAWNDLKSGISEALSRYK
jgi:chromosome segregation ATPase